MDGVEVATVTATSAASRPYPVIVGRADNLYMGGLDEDALYSRGLTPAGLLSHHQHRCSTTKVPPS